MKPAEFWELTPAEFQNCIDGYMDMQETENRRTARICALLHNINRDPKKGHEVTEEDYMPKRKKKQSPDDMLKQVELINMQLGGKDGR